MGQGIDLAKGDSPEHAEMIDNLKDQLLIAFVNRLGGDVIMPASEIDETGKYLMSYKVNPDTKEFYFKVSKKN